MKKFFLASIVVLSLIFFATDTEAAYPARDTWVLSWGGYDYYVKAGTLDYDNPHVDAAPEFSCVIAFDDELAHCQFRARGYAVMYVDGEFFGDSQKNQFVNALYNAICNKLIYRR